jgi:DNA polymerase III alpha subunit
MCKKVNICELENLDKYRGQTIVFRGKVIQHQPRITKTRKHYSISILEDQSGKHTIYLFGQYYQKFKDVIKEGIYLTVKGEVPEIDLGDGIYIRYISMTKNMEEL